MKAWSSWFPDLIPHVPGCPNVEARHELRRSAQVFFGATRAWKVIEAALPVNANQATVTGVPSNSEQELVRIESVHYDDRELDLEDLDGMAAKYGVNWAGHTGAPSKYLLVTPGEIRLYPVPTEAAITGVTRTLSVQPSDSSTGLPDDLAAKYRNEITTGAKARLMIMPNKPWTNMELGGVMNVAFDGMTGKGNLGAALSFGRGRLSSRPSWC